MKTDNWNPGYSTNKDYPFNGIESRKLNMVDDTITELDFLKIRLETAENQIEEIFHEMPFTPETFGFELIHQNKDIHEKPVRMYISKYNDAITLYQKPSDPLSDTFNPYQWVLLEKITDGQFKEEINLVLPCHRIAYAAFYALGVKIEEPVDDKMNTYAEVVYEPVESEFNMEEDAEAMRNREEKAVVEPKTMDDYHKENQLFDEATHEVKFYRAEGDITGLLPIKAKSDKDALTQAKFIIETDESLNIKDVLFEELTIVGKPL